MNYQFNPSQLESIPEIDEQISKGYQIRPLALSDYENGILQVLTQLTHVGEISKDQFKERFEWLKARNDSFYHLVIEDVESKEIVATGSLILERKFIHECGLCGHIEDICTSEKVRGKGMGKWMILQLIQLAKSQKAYKSLVELSRQEYWVL